MGKYFKAFPLTSYANTVCTDILRTSKITPTTIKESSIYYQFDIQDGQRPDTISFDYYKNPYYDWVVYKVNDIVDPYDDWFMSHEVFKSFISSKYGSIAQAQEKVLYYKVNWSGDDTKLTTAAYDGLSHQVRQYWRPAGDMSPYYIRKELDWKVSTNMIVKVFVSDPTIFVSGDYINQLDMGSVSASGEVCFVGSDHILVQHVEGTFAPNSTINIPLGEGSTTASSTLPLVVQYGIPLTEMAYWQKVNAYDYEDEVNNEKKSVRLISKDYLQAIQREHEVKING